MDIYAKKKKKKWPKEKIERADDLASRMMASPRFEGDWATAFALSRSMENKGYEVKKKPDKPHKKYVPKKKAAEFIGSLCKIAEGLDGKGLYQEADAIMGMMNSIMLGVE